MDLNNTQKQAVLHKDGPLLVLAGAGSGKTRIVTHRIASLIDEGVDPSAIVAVTFTNKAAREMMERIEKLAPFGGVPLIATFHSLGVRILRESIHHLGFQTDFAIYDEDDSNKILKSIIPKGQEEQLKSIRSQISYVKNQILAPEEMGEAFRALYLLYQSRLKESNALDFDDLLYLPVRLFKEHPDVLALYQNRWRYLLIDEYQDTNHAQYLLARLLIEKTHNLFVVGDPDQSIYSWRGANISNILNFEKDYPGAKVVSLEQNYRSRKIILDAANALISHNQGRYKKNLWSDRVGGEKIALAIAPSDREEAGYVVSEIERLHRYENIPLKEITILYRTNFQSRSFEDYLLRKKIPYVIVGGISFYQRKEIKDLLSFLQMIISDHNFVAFARTINLPKRGFGEVSLEKIGREARERGISILEMCRNHIDEMKLNEKQKSGLKEYLQLIANLRVIAETESLKTIVIETIRRSGYLEVLREDKETYEDRKANIDELVAKADEWENGEETGALSQFLEELSLKGSIDQADFKDDKVSLMTMHNGKGLEFAVAFLVGLEEDLFPHANSRGNFESVEEERRLCYVGMTRAKERLYLTAAESRFLWGNLRMMRPSRFLKEIPRELYERVR